MKLTEELIRGGIEASRKFWNPMPINPMDAVPNIVAATILSIPEPKQQNPEGESNV